MCQSLLVYRLSIPISGSCAVGDPARGMWGMTPPERCSLVTHIHKYGLQSHVNASASSSFHPDRATHPVAHHDRVPRRSATARSRRLDHRAVHTRRTTSYPSAVVRAATLCSSKRTPEERLGPIGANEVSDRSYCGLCTPADVLGLGLAAGADTWFGECAQDTMGHR